MIQSAMRNQTAWGYVGSDRLNEDGIDWFREIIEPVRNKNNQLLRFALIANDVDRLRRKITFNEPLSVLTSYPLTASTVIGFENNYEYIQGGIEAELRERKEIDAGFELVQSGDSVRANGLDIVIDDIEQVNIECIRTPYDW